MVILSNSDMFEVRINSLLADYDRETLTNLYQPIIGYSALALYFTFWSEASIQKVLSFSTHEQIFIRMKMAPGNFIEARKLLEAVGLVKTKLEKAPGTNIYHYQLNAPKTPKGFFADTLLYGMLIQSLGEKDAERLKRVYELNAMNEEGEDISSSFNEVFHPDFEDPSFKKAASSEINVVGRNKSKIETEFSYEKFFVELGNVSQISEKAISKKEMKEVERLASLYGVNEEVTASIVAEHYDVSKDKGERLDFTLINESLMGAANYSFIAKKAKNMNSSNISSDTALAKKIKLFEEVSPLKLLSYLQGGTKISPSDAKLIDTLSKDYRLPNGLINVVLDFVLSRNKNILSSSYAQKIAASFNREGIETILDAMNYCNSVIADSNKKRKSYKKNVNDENNVKKEENKINSGASEEEAWDSLIKELEKDDDGKVDDELPF